MLGVTRISPRAIHAASARVQSFVERKLSGGVRLPCRAHIDNRMTGWVPGWASIFACIVPSPRASPWVFMLCFSPCAFPILVWPRFKPLPGTIVTYVQLPPSRKDVAALAAPIAPAVLTQPELETTGRSTSQAQEPASPPQLQMVEPPAQQPKAKPRREARSESSTPQRAVCLPGYDSSGAQTRPC